MAQNALGLGHSTWSSALFVDDGAHLIKDRRASACLAFRFLATLAYITFAIAGAAITIHLVATVGTVSVAVTQVGGLDAERAAGQLVIGAGAGVALRCFTAFGQIDGVARTISRADLFGCGTLTLYAHAGTVSTTIIGIARVVGVIDTVLAVGAPTTRDAAAEVWDAVTGVTDVPVGTLVIIFALGAGAIRLWTAVRNRWPRFTCAGQLTEVCCIRASSAGVVQTALPVGAGQVVVTFTPIAIW